MENDLFAEVKMNQFLVYLIHFKEFTFVLQFYLCIEAAFYVVFLSIQKRYILNGLCLAAGYYRMKSVREEKL